ncbi:nitrate- and nitrite sensing domain-containing protein [Parafrankia sp. EUN1f]|uniref:sensor histidine kinase n=1 Tax=Parafrankia sp. EUN1f TaxID=102897 RepID=UPI0001C449AB|nr:nitrate- and nitrite sensing domain-containing protein [Parafrankia sp. EUN1f]EFC86567.1 histidine kinase [Parafrankia sp. EUN1f]
MLRNWPIRSKLVVILLVPLAALAVLSAIQVRGDVNNVREADRIEALANFSIKASDLVDALQNERYATNAFAGSNFNALAAPLAKAVETTRGPVDEALAVYRTGEQGLPASAREQLAVTLSAISEHLNQLPEHRKQFDARKLQVTTNIAFYDAAVKDLMLLNARVASGSSDASLVNGATTLAGISQAKEQASQQRGAIAKILFQKGADWPTVLALQATAGSEDAWIEQFRTTATAGQQDFFNTTVGRSKTTVDQTRDRIISTLTGSGALTMAPAEWVELANAKIAQMREVERRVASDLGSTSARISKDASRGALLGSIGVAAILIVSIIISLLVASPMISQLRRLRGGALEVASERLPAVVDRLHRGEPVDIDAEAFPIPATSKDEIGQLADAFATVHEVAVRTAVEQAAMRKSIGDTFLNLARRSQALIHRQLKIIDALERKETDPDELEELFRLDHLATRMRRHAEDLIVLSGSKPARGWRRPVPIKDVVRGAVAEVEDYTRVKVLPITGGSVSGHAVGDVIHMFAELIENATSFSPPHTPVQVSGHPVSNGFVVEIEDRGLGMSQEEIDALNHRLANPPPFDLSTSERLGLFVVGRLAERHTIQVQLRSSPYGGTLAIVLLPEALLRASDDKAEDSGPREFAAVGAVNAGALNGSVAPLNAETEIPADLSELAELGPAASTSNGRWHGDLGGDSVDGAGAQAKIAGTPTAGPTADETLIDDLPVFATARSSWFVADRPRGGRPLDEDAPLPPNGTGDWTSPMPLSEVTDPDDEAAGDPQATDDPSDGWPHGGYGRQEQEPSDGRYRPPSSLFSPPATDSLFNAPPDTGQFPGFGPGGFDNGAGAGSDGGRGANGAGPGGFGNTDYPTTETGRGGFGLGAGFTGDSSGFRPGGGDGFGAPDDALPLRRRGTPRGNGSGNGSGNGNGSASGFHGGADAGTGQRDPRADRAAGYGRSAREGGRGDGAYRGGEYTTPGYPGSAPHDGGASGDGYRTGGRSSRAPEGNTGRPPYGADSGPGQPGVATEGGAGEPPIELDELGLPKRRRRASLAPQLRRENTDTNRTAMAAGPRSPEEIRSMMSSFQANFGRGIEDGTLSNDGDDVGKVT